MPTPLPIPADEVTQHLLRIATLARSFAASRLIVALSALKSPDDEEATAAANAIGSPEGWLLKITNDKLALVIVRLIEASVRRSDEVRVAALEAAVLICISSVIPGGQRAIIDAAAKAAMRTETNAYFLDLLDLVRTHAHGDDDLTRTNWYAWTSLGAEYYAALVCA